MTPVLYKSSKNSYGELPEELVVVDDLMEIANLIKE